MCVCVCVEGGLLPVLAVGIKTAIFSNGHLSPTRAPRNQSVTVASLSHISTILIVVLVWSPPESVDVCVKYGDVRYTYESQNMWMHYTQQIMIFFHSRPYIYHIFTS